MDLWGRRQNVRGHSLYHTFWGCVQTDGRFWSKRWPRLIIAGMDIALFWQGLIFGLAIAAPVGPIGVLTIRRTLVGGLWAGLLSGLGAATADAFYGSVAALGLTAVSAFLVQQQLWLRLFGGLFLVYLGVKAAREKPAAVSSEALVIAGEPGQLVAESSPGSLLRAYSSTFFLTLSNPVTILSFTAVFAGFGLGSQAEGAGAGWQLVTGVFLGSALWWLTLCGVVTAVRTRLSPTVLRAINLVSGLILVGFGLALLSSLLLSR